MSYFYGMSDGVNRNEGSWIYVTENLESNSNYSHQFNYFFKYFIVLSQFFSGYSRMYEYVLHSKTTKSNL